MANTETILKKLDANTSFSRSDLTTVMEECGINTTESKVNHQLLKMLSSGNIVRIGRNKYRVAEDLKIYSFPHSEFANSIAAEITEAHPYLDFRIFELVQLNEFVNHQIAHNILFVSVEAGLECDVFNTLWESHQGSVLLKPNEDELFRYMTDDMMVIQKLATESPRGTTVFWDTRLEKMLVDIAVDKLLGKVIYSGEYPAIYQDIFRKYAIDKSAMFRYARRRGALDKYKQFLLNEAGLKQEEFTL